MPDPQTPDIQTTIKDPKFLALGPDDQVAVLKTLKSAPTTKPAAKSSIAPPPQPEEGMLTKLGRGAALGAASGLGIPESTSPTKVVTGALSNAAEGFGHAAKGILMDPIEGTYNVVDTMARNLEAAGGESWEGLKQQDPEKFAHGFGSALAQILTLHEAKEGKPGPSLVRRKLFPESVERGQLAKVKSAVGAGPEQIADLRKSMPEVVKAAQTAGINTVGDFGKTIRDTKNTIDQTFNQGLLPVANNQYVPMEISRAIRSLETPDMVKTAEGREQIRQIRRAALEYERPWTVNQLNAKRMTENENLRSFYNKDTRAQSASPLDTGISKAIRDKAADIVYQQWDHANPNAPIKAQELKSRQGALWALDDFINHPKNGAIAKLDAKQLEHEDTGFLDRVRPGAYASKTGLHGYVSGIAEGFTRGPEKRANAKMKSAFGDPTIAGRVKTSALPISVLAEQDRQDVKKAIRRSAIPPPPEPPQ
jgi:hypothetical protein